MKRPSVLPQIIKQLIRHEGLSLSAYLDSVGILTIGVGHNCRASVVAGVNRVGDTITHAQAFNLLGSDVESLEAGMLQEWPWMSELDDARYGVMVNMTFNMGVKRLGSFKNTLRLIRRGDYEQAAVNMLKSKWAKQVHAYPPDSPEARRAGRPGRAWELANQMHTGIWQGVE